MSDLETKPKSQEQTKLQNYEEQIIETARVHGFSSEAEVQNYKRAKFFSQTTLIPKDFQGNVANCYLAIEIAQEMNTSARDIMNSIYVVHGRPGWYAEAQVRLLKKKHGLDIHYKMDEKEQSVIAFTVDKEGNKVMGDKVSMEMAKAENWTKNPKYQSMPMYMLKKRAATFLIRSSYPEVLAGYQGIDEIKEIIDVEARPANRQVTRTISGLKAKDVIGT